MAQLERAYFYNRLTDQFVDIMFNPEKVTVKKTVPWNEQAKPGKDQPKHHFTSGKARTISLSELQFDTSGMDGDGPDATDVREYVEPLMALANVPTDQDEAYPPVLDFMWGEGLTFVCLMKSITVNYTRFNADGAPIRASATIELVEAEDPELQFKELLMTEDVEIRTPQRGTPLNTTEDWRELADNNPQAMQNGNPRNASGESVVA